MGLLRRFVLAGAASVLAAQMAAAGLSDRHELAIALDWHLTDTSSRLGAWPEAGFGKLRYGSDGSAGQWSRLALAYRGQIASQFFTHAVLDYIDDAAQHVGLTEAYVEWRPLPRSLNRHRLRFGAFYPPLSFENADFAWESPYSRSFSAINAWIGEEIRPVGADWRLTRPIGRAASPHELDVFAGLFYGNDAAATLLFWRGWSVHDRQTRLNERLPLPPLVMPAPGGGPDRIIERRLDPIAEIDDRPGIYLGSEWTYAERARLAVAFWDNRGDPKAFRDSQWAWGTRFWQLAGQFALPAGVGLVAQHMRGDTDWLTNVRPTGMTTPETALESDEFEASFLLLSRNIGSDHRISLRRDEFEIWRPGGPNVDGGDATTIAYQYRLNPRVSMRLEWLEIDSTRDLWPKFYGQTADRFRERQLQLGFRFVLFDSAA